LLNVKLLTDVGIVFHDEALRYVLHR